MISNITTFTQATRIAVGALAFITIATFMSAPLLSNAAIYAYVNTDGEVRMVTANDPTTAIMTAPGRALRSGVMLLMSATDSIVGDSVGGV